jgi:hypothetical protein
MIRHRNSIESGKGRKRAISLALMMMGVFACLAVCSAQRSEKRRSEPDPRAPLTPESAQLSQKVDQSAWRRRFSRRGLLSGLPKG